MVQWQDFRLPRGRPGSSGIFNVTKTMEPTVFEISPPQLVILDAEKEVYIKLLLLGKNQTEFGGPDNYYHVVRYLPSTISIKSCP